MEAATIISLDDVNTMILKRGGDSLRHAMRARSARGRGLDILASARASAPASRCLPLMLTFLPM